MNDTKTVRWMVSFWHPDGGSRDESDFPEVAFWHPDRESAREEAARVLIELREERADGRDWVAAGHPDPFEVGAGRHSGGQWILRYEDLRRGDDANGASLMEGGAAARRADRRPKRTKPAAGAWQGIIPGEEVKQMLYEARRTGSRAEPAP